MFLRRSLGGTPSSRAWKFAFVPPLDSFINHSSTVPSLSPSSLSTGYSLDIAARIEITVDEILLLIMEILHDTLRRKIPVLDRIFKDIKGSLRRI